jgi:hypothetical protein
VDARIQTDRYLACSRNLCMDFALLSLAQQCSIIHCSCCYYSEGICLVLCSTALKTFVHLRPPVVAGVPLKHVDTVDKSQPVIEREHAAQFSTCTHSAAAGC